MSWDVHWKIPWRALDEARIGAAVRQEVAERPGVEARLERRGDAVVVFVSLPEALVRRLDMGIEPLPESEDGAFWGEIKLDVMEIYPEGEDSPFEPLEEVLDCEITSICRRGDTAYAASTSRQCYELRDGAFRPLDPPKSGDGPMAV